MQDGTKELTLQFNAILSSAAIAVMLSYLQPIIIRVFWPLTSCVARLPPGICYTDAEASLSERGPFSLGRWSWPINLASFLVSPPFLRR